MNARLLSIVALIVLMASGTYARAQDQQIDGTWRVSLPAHAEGVVLELKSQGTSVSGAFAVPHQADLKMIGQLIGTTLTLQSAEGSPMQLRMEGTLSADGTLAGQISGASPMKWTARRVP
jgi:hypothetical protein